MKLGWVRSFRRRRFSGITRRFGFFNEIDVLRTGNIFVVLRRSLWSRWSSPRKRSTRSILDWSTRPLWIRLSTDTSRTSNFHFLVQPEFRGAGVSCLHVGYFTLKANLYILSHLLRLCALLGLIVLVVEEPCYNRLAPIFGRKNNCWCCGTFF